MIKYKATSALNYLSENSYKGDGAPGMVMGIASDARGDTNTYEDTKKLDEVHNYIESNLNARRMDS